ncbi:DUF4136 domain-containing protein [Croceicoccus marinus]|uniref:DUF4136 domain-containing protein n=1 Tax=Croceicoccus marinus TaxID=450378 RepID=A0A7G6VVV8_9SPHN|nr:DUF4136 domain-containing protein [Croceicoccus marinus]QNE05873.1 DUF4136 domain-containing protein [Croceicoccus marinus]
MTQTHLRRPALVAALLASAMLAGCAPSMQPIEVTRFHAPTIAETGQYGSIAVQAAPGNEESLALAPYEQAVSAELAQVGFSPAAAGSAARVAEVRVSRSSWQPGRDGSPVSVGVGGSTGGYGSGVGVGLGIDLSGPPAEQVSTQLSVVIRDRVTGQSVWEGRAEQVVDADSALAQPAASAQALADALFVDFPGENGESFSVKPN